MATINYYKESVKLLTSLHKDHPTFSLGRHLATALCEYGDMWNISNKEFLFALQKYEAEMELNNDEKPHEEYVNNIIKDGMNLDTILDEEDDEDF